MPLGINLLMPSGPLAGHLISMETIYALHHDYEGPQLGLDWGINFWRLRWTLDNNSFTTTIFKFKKAGLSAAIDALGLHRWRKDLYIPPITNRTPFYRTQVGKRDWSEFHAIIDSLPDDVVAKFHREPYISCPWFESLALPNPCATTHSTTPAAAHP